MCQVALAQTVVGVSGLTLDESRGLVSVNCCPSSPDQPSMDATYSQVSFPAPCTPPCTAPPSEQEYSEVMLNPTCLCDEGPEGHATAPLYRRADHIYDEPQVKDSRTPPSEYDIPEELKGDAWKVMAAPADPRSHLYSTPKRGRGDHHVTVQEMPEEAHKLYNNVMTGCHHDNSDDKII